MTASPKSSGLDQPAHQEPAAQVEHAAPERGRPAARPWLLLIDYLLPLGAGVTLVIALWRNTISHCRGWEQWDPSHHLVDALKLFYQPDLRHLVGNTYPKLVHLWSGVLFTLFGPERQSADLSVACFLIPLCLIIYHLGKEFGGRAAGITCLALLPLVHDTLKLSQLYLLDVPLLTMVALMLLVFLRTRLFRSRRASLLLGLVIAAGLLTKNNFFYFCAPLLFALVYLTIRAARGPVLPGLLLLLGSGAGAAFFMVPMPPQPEPTGIILLACFMAGGAAATLFLLISWWWGTALARSPQRLEAVRNLVLALGVGITPALPFYLCNRHILLTRWTMHVGLSRSDGEQLATYFLGTTKFAPLLPALIMAGVLALIVKQGRRPERLMVLLSGIPALLFLARGSLFEPRLLLPALPFFLLPATWWLGSLKRWRWVAMAGVIFLSTPVGRQLPKFFTGEHERFDLHATLAGHGLGPKLPQLSRQDQDHCKVARRMEVLASHPRLAPLRARTQGWELACIFPDASEAQKVHIQQFIPGFSCSIFGTYLKGAVSFVPSVTLLNAPGQPPEMPKQSSSHRNIIKRWILLYPGVRGELPDRLKQALERLHGGRLQVGPFVSIERDLGVHILEISGRFSFPPTSDARPAGRPAQKPTHAAMIPPCAPQS